MTQEQQILIERQRTLERIARAMGHFEEADYLRQFGDALENHDLNEMHTEVFCAMSGTRRFEMWWLS